MYTYGGKEMDENTNLYYFNARYYDATTGRFINVDPIQDGSNWYVYCKNNPMNFVDPTGLTASFLRKFSMSVSLRSPAFPGRFRLLGDKSKQSKDIERFGSPCNR